MADHEPKRGADASGARRPAGLPDVSATQILSAAERRRRARRGATETGIRFAGRARRSGPSISLKFALAVSVTIAGFMFLFGIVVLRNVRNALNEEIDAAGILAARALAIHELFVWNEFHRAFAGTPFAQYEEEIAAGERRVPRSELTDEQLRQIEQRREYNRSLLSKFLEADERVLDVVISTPDRSRMIRVASGRPKLDFEGKRVYSRAGVDVEYGTYTPPDGRSLRARSYVAPILGPNGEVQGRAAVVLSESSIQEELARVRGQILVLALVFVGLGVGVSFYVGNRITSPILALTEDVEIIAEGDLEHRPRVHTTDEIGVLAKTIEAMAVSLREAQERQVEHERQKHQLRIALEIQKNLFPQRLPSVETCDLEAFYLPGPEIGGDYYDVFTLPDGRLALMVASASGRGIPAMMVTVMARSFTAAVAERERSGPDILRSVNRLLSPDLRRGMYVTALLCIFDPKTGQLEISNAGHQPLVFYRAETKSVEAVHADGIALGFDKGPVFDRSLRPRTETVRAGDRIVLTTPGVYAVKNHEGRELGEENFYRLVARYAEKPSSAFVRLVAETIQKYAEAGEIESDITFVTLKRLV